MKIKNYMLETTNSFKQLKIKNIIEFEESKDKDGFDLIYEIMCTCHGINNIDNEEVYIIGFKGNDIVGTIKISDGNINSAKVDFNTVFSFLLISDCDGFIQVHNHPCDEEPHLKFSQQDINEFNNIRMVALELGISPIENMLITGNYYALQRREVEVQVCKED